MTRTLARATTSAATNAVPPNVVAWNPPLLTPSPSLLRLSRTTSPRQLVALRETFDRVYDIVLDDYATNMGWHDVLTGGSMFNGEAHSRRLLFSAFAEHINPALLALLVRSLDGSMPTAPELAATGGYDESAFLAYLKIALREDREDTTPADLVYSGHTRQPRSRRTQHESDSRNGMAGMGIWQSYAKAADEFTDLQFTGTVIVPEPSTPAENVLDGLLVHFAEASSHIGSAHVSANSETTRP